MASYNLKIYEAATQCQLVLVHLIKQNQELVIYIEKSCIKGPIHILS